MNKTTKVLQQEIDELKSQVAHLKSCKRYGLEWEEKEEEFDKLSRNSFPVLTAKNDDNYPNISSNDSSNQRPHILIEGDNYHSLSILSYTHKNKIDIIYIDPPYNTGNKDFRYNDKFIDKDDFFRHSKWLSFMNKRLKLAKELLTNNGVIFISIDDNEQAQLKLLCNEIFGENNFLGCLTWIKRTKSTNSGKAKLMIQQKTEYILTYSRQSSANFNGFKLLYSDKVKQYPHLGVFGKCRFENLEATDYGRKKRDTMKFPILGVKPKDGRRWQIGEETANKLVKQNKIELVDGVPKKAVYPDDEAQESFIPFWSHIEDAGSAESGKKELSDIVGPDHGFDTVKPIPLMRKIFERFDDNITVLDFFVGSGTTGDAILELNKDGGSRQLILCTNNENNICEEITYKRIRCIIEGYTNLKGKKVKGLGGTLKYFKTGFIKKQNNDTVTDEDKIKLTYEVGTVLALKENTFDEVKKSTHYQIFSSSKQLTAIYFSENKIDLSELIEHLINQEKPCKLYLFSWTKGEYKHEFSEYENITAEDIPEPILDVYKSIGVI